MGLTMGLIPKWSREAARIGLELAALQIEAQLVTDGMCRAEQCERLNRLRLQISELPRD